MSSSGFWRDEQFQKLVGRLSFKVHQHVSELTDFNSMLEALKKIYTKKKNVFACRNKLLNCRQSSSENVKQYLQRLNDIAKQCQFTRPASQEENRSQWICQQYIAGLESRDMRRLLGAGGNCCMASLDPF